MIVISHPNKITGVLNHPLTNADRSCKFLPYLKCIKGQIAKVFFIIRTLSQYCIYA